MRRVVGININDRGEHPVHQFLEATSSRLVCHIPFAQAISLLKPSTPQHLQHP